MKKTTLILLSPLCLLYANTDRPTTNHASQKLEKEKDASMPWNRDDVIKARDAVYDAREKRSRELEMASEKLANSRDGNSAAKRGAELDDTQEEVTVLEMKPKGNSESSSIIVEKPKSIEKPKVEGLQLETIKDPLPVGVKKESIVIVTEIKKATSAPKVIKVVAISKTTKRETRDEIEENALREEAEKLAIPEDVPEIAEPVELNQKTKALYPTKFMIIKESN